MIARLLPLYSLLESVDYFIFQQHIAELNSVRPSQLEPSSNIAASLIRLGDPTVNTYLYFVYSETHLKALDHINQEKRSLFLRLNLFPSESSPALVLYWIALYLAPVGLNMDWMAAAVTRISSIGTPYEIAQISIASTFTKQCTCTRICCIVHDDLEWYGPTINPWDNPIFNKPPDRYTTAYCNKNSSARGRCYGLVIVNHSC